MHLITQVYNRAGLTQSEIEGMDAFIAGESEVAFYDSPQFEKLYEYLAFGIAVMPYEAAKGKTETPDEWIMAFIETWSGLPTNVLME